MRAKYVGNKADRILMNVKNTEASASIPLGTPVVLDLAYTAAAATDGLGVVLPSTAGSPLSYSLKYGVVTSTLTTGQYGESVLFGVATSAIIIKTTRAASTDSWSATASSASGIGLGIDTINNAFTMGASIAGAIASNAQAAVLLDSVSNVVASASNTSDTRTANTALYRVFVRML